MISSFTLPSACTVCAAASLPSPIISDGRRKKPCGTAAGATGKPSMIFIFVFRKKIFPRPRRKCAGSIPLVNPLVKKGQKTLQNVHQPYHPAQNNSTAKRRKPLEIARFSSISRGFPVERIMGIEPTSTAWEAVVLPMNYIRVFCLLMYSTKICLKSQATKKDS